MEWNSRRLGAVADLGGARPARAPPYGSKFSQFHAVFREIWQNHMLAPPPGGLAPPPTGNPGSAPEVVMFMESCPNLYTKL